MRNWLTENTFNFFSLFFGVGGIGYAVVSKILDRKKYEQEVRTEKAQADFKGDEFWRSRYEILQAEVRNKDTWWKERYDNLYKEFQDERKLSNEIVKSFRNEVTELRKDYEKQREDDKQRYDKLLEEYKCLEEESNNKNKGYMNRINQLEEIISQYEKRLKAIDEK